MILRPSENPPLSNPVIASIAYALSNIIGLYLFFGTSYTMFFLFEQTDSPVANLSFLAILITISLFRVISRVLHIVLSPSVRSFRILPLDYRTSKNIYQIMVTTMSAVITVLMFSVVIHKLGAAQQSVQLLQLFFTTLLLSITAIFILIYKNQVRDHITAAGGNSHDSEY